MEFDDEDDDSTRPDDQRHSLRGPSGATRSQPTSTSKYIMNTLIRTEYFQYTCSICAYRSTNTSWLLVTTSTKVKRNQKPFHDDKCSLIGPNIPTLHPSSTNWFFTFQNFVKKSFFPTLCHASTWTHNLNCKIY